MAPTRLEVLQRQLEEEFPLAAIDDGAGDAGHTVGELLPDGYARYLRVFHPALWADARYPHRIVPKATRTWRSIAEEVGAVYHPEIMWRGALDDGSAAEGGSARYEVSEGRLDDPARSALFELLGATEAREVYYLYYLSGIIRADGPMLYRAPLQDHAQVHAAASELLGEGPDTAPGPEFIWPIDRSWVVNTDYDLESTYVACHETLAEQILNAAEIEALPVSRSTRIDWYADQINTALHEAAPPTSGDILER